MSAENRPSKHSFLWRSLIALGISTSLSCTKALPDKSPTPVTPESNPVASLSKPEKIVISPPEKNKTYSPTLTEKTIFPSPIQTSTPEPSPSPSLEKVVSEISLSSIEQIELPPTEENIIFSYQTKLIHPWFEPPLLVTSPTPTETPTKTPSAPLETKIPLPTPGAEVICSALHIRKGPWGEITGILKKGDKVWVTGYADVGGQRWYRINLEGGQEAWISGFKDYVKPNEAVQAVPEIEKEKVPPTPTPETTPEVQLSLWEEKALDAVREIRKEMGVGDVKLSKTLVDVARGRSQYMATTNDFSHKTSEGGTVFDLLGKESPSKRDYRGEILFKNDYQESQIEEAMKVMITKFLESPTHREVLLRKQHLKEEESLYIGVGYAFSEEDGMRYVTVILSSYSY